ncbi:MAG: ATP phosphoribosyltransferase [bacterium]|nr:ATP phosphoribosyltransferase [Candidatus Kapabacteria bacterium]
MIARNGRLKIAVQKGGRLTAESLGLLRACGLSFDPDAQALHTPCRNFDLDLLAVRDDDIPEYVQDGVADLGIVGENIVIESRADVRTLAPLGFGRCRLMICVPEQSAMASIADLVGKRIATSYPSTLDDFLKREGIDAQIVTLSGAVELAPTLDVADAICDLVSTGSTARINGLRLMQTVLESQSVLVACPGSLECESKRKLVDRLMIRVQGSLAARGKRYLMLNAPKSSVESLASIIPSMTSPTVVPLADSDMVAVHTVVAEEVFWEVMERLRDAGARDIVVTPIETIIR